MTAPENLTALLPEFLARQRWFGSGGEVPDGVEVLEEEQLVRGWPEVHRLAVEAAGIRWNVLVGLRPEGWDVPGPPTAHLGRVSTADGPATAYDALWDQELALALLGQVTEGRESADHARVLGAEQSNTSVVFDDRLVLKVFRRLLQGGNPDAEVTVALADAGFEHLARPVALWQGGGADLGLVQEWLPDAVDGWSLALTSLRDLLGGDEEDPAMAGGDFGAEAARLGRVTGDLHLALARAFDVERTRHEGGACIRTHGDYHLGQVLRADAGWIVVDFEGEPLRSLEERRRLASPLRDVAGMLRSFDYAAQVALVEREPDRIAELRPRVLSWERRARYEFLHGYYDTPGIGGLLPPSGPARDQVLLDEELAKARYEVDYERGHRPEWAWIPEGAVARLERAAAG